MSGALLPEKSLKHYKKSDRRCKQPMRVLVKNIACPVLHWERKHAPTVARRPIGDGKASLVAGNKSADEEEREREYGCQDGKAMQPRLRGFIGDRHDESAERIRARFRSTNLVKWKSRTEA